VLENLEVLPAFLKTGCKVKKMDDLDVTPPSPGVPGVNPIQLAVGLVRADQWLVLPLWLLLSVLTPIQLLMSDVGGL
jgi:hypothetical protein